MACQGENQAERSVVICILVWTLYFPFVAHLLGIMKISTSVSDMVDIKPAYAKLTYPDLRTGGGLKLMHHIVPRLTDMTRI
jgi:hypothetical protein